MFLSLPSEILVSVLKYLPLSDISSCIQTSRVLKNLIDQHESTVYRQAAAHPSLRLIPHDQVLFSELIPLGLLSKRYIGDASDWKSLCRRACEVHSCWLGKGPSRIKDYYHAYVDYATVHRIKVDEKRGFIITTHGHHDSASQGRVMVSDISDGQPIWGLDSRHVRQYAHCEYGEGFLIFDRSVDAKEVWRLVSVNPEIPDPEEFEVVPQSKPDEAQLSAIHTASPAARLKFVPHAILCPPGDVPSCAFRFVYPTLVVASRNCLLFWDVRTGEMVERMDDIGGQMPHGWSAGTRTWSNVVSNFPSQLGEILYVDTNDKYALVCGEDAFKLFQRKVPQAQKSAPEASGTANCVIGLTSNQIWERGRWEMVLGYVQSEDLPPNFEDHRAKDTLEEAENEKEFGIMDHTPGNDLQDLGLGSSATDRRASNDHSHPRIDFWKCSGKAVVTHKLTPRESKLAHYLANYPMAAHISPCGQHLAILINGSRLLIIPYFERVIDRRVKDYRNITIDLDIASPLGSIYLAYEDGRIALVTQTGLFIVYPTFSTPDDLKMPPKLHVQRVVLLNDGVSLSYVSCLQMTSTGIWINWEVTPNGHDLAKLEADEKEFEERLYSGQLFLLGRLHRNSVVLSVDFGLGFE